jgi:hypothetical protein
MAREGRSEVSNFVFINYYYNCGLRGRLFCKTRENRVFQ